jgi:hypothetical protein
VKPTPAASIFPITTSEQMSMFSIKAFEDRLQQHLTEIFNVKTIIERSTIKEKTKGEKSRIVLKVSGETKDVENALEDLMNLFSLLRTRIFNDKTSTKFHSSNKPNILSLLFQMAIGRKSKKLLKSFNIIYLQLILFVHVKKSLSQLFISIILILPIHNSVLMNKKLKI